MLRQRAISAKGLFHVFGVYLIAAGLWLAAAPVQAEAVQIRLNGLTLNGAYVPGKDPASAARAVLIVHGTLAHHDMDTVKGLRSALALRRIGTLAITLSLGLDGRRGMYDCATPHRHRHTHAFSEIAAWLDWLAAKGVRDVTLMGHSRGGNQAAWFTLEHPHRLVKRLVLPAPGAWSEPGSAGSFEKTHGRPLADVLAEARKLTEAGKGDQVIQGVGLLFCRGADATADTFLSYYAPDPRRDTPTLLPKIPVPVLVVAGGRDTVVRDLPERVRPLVDGKRLRLAVIADADHFFLDLLAEDVVDAIEAFLKPAG